MPPLCLAPGRVSYLQQQLVLGDPLHWFDEVGRDGVSQSVPLLDLLLQSVKHKEKEKSNE